ncbi:MAG: phage Gp37/Gp68 family protein [Rhodoferax sp.]|uniref:phage Gp37/Gp68 family protein n=1 Tax=Rhodoferax sp. TaxID=50421 RepID=UPI00272EEC72|nr:phage Gp37/Gp68 family protein [Rhodoferax sp.]MDP1530279.1 phage Gp37/Gp68 family protein [Rhodoferax sp.]MDP1943374.1 phage Gp37/Gp68 family protein [Rhodoferax sp.]
MSQNTKIEWADHTFNPWIGCTKVGPGCDNCYAKADFDDRKHRVTWGAGQARSRTKTWGDPVRWNKQADVFFAEHGRRQRVFCASLADVFDNEVDPAWRADLFRLIAETPNLDWLLLTKRIGNAYDMIKAARGLPDCQWYGQANVWIGATICNQEEADRDIPKLLAVPAAKRFLSMEPLLGPVDLGLCDCDMGSRPGPNGVGGVTCARCNGGGGRMLDWVIVGGESGPNARPMHPDWVRSLRDQCQAAGVPFLFKQWGEWASAKGYPGHIPVGHVFDDGYQMIRAGKKAAGRLLDGREWNGVPS